MVVLVVGIPVCCGARDDKLHSFKFAGSCIHNLLVASSGSHFVEEKRKSKEYQTLEDLPSAVSGALVAYRVITQPLAVPSPANKLGFLLSTVVDNELVHNYLSFT